MQGRKKARCIDQHHRRRILCQEHVRRRSRAFLHDLVPKLGIAAVADRDLDAGVMSKSIGPSFGKRGMLRVVNQNGFGLGSSLYRNGLNRCNCRYDQQCSDEAITDEFH